MAKKKRKKHHGGHASEELLQKWHEELIRKRRSPKAPKERRGTTIVAVSPKRTDVRSFVHIKSVEDVDTVVKCFTWPTLKYNREDDFYIQDCIGGNKKLMDYYHQKMRNYFGIEHMLRKEEKAREARIRKTHSPYPSGNNTLIIRTNSTTEKKEDTTKSEVPIKKTKEPAFNVLKAQTWILDWNCVKFKKDYIVVFPPDNPSINFKPKAVSAPGSIESFNYLNDYFNDRLSPVHCSVKGMEIDVYDTIRLNEAIQKFTTVAKQRGITTSGTIKIKKISPQKMSFDQALSKAQQMTLEDFKKYKSKFIDFLVSQQSPNQKVIPCVEKLAHSNSETTEYAFMFALQCKSDNMLVVHENVNPDRSTLLFVIPKDKEQFNKSIRYIYDFLQSAEINKRSGIREGSLRCNANVIDYKSINHDNYCSWHKAIEWYISTAIHIPRRDPNLIKTKFHSLSRLLREVQAKENFEKVRPFFKENNLPLTRKVKPAEIMALIPESKCRIDKDGRKILPVKEGAWSLEKLTQLIKGS